MKGHNFGLSEKQTVNHEAGSEFQTQHAAREEEICGQRSGAAFWPLENDDLYAQGSMSQSGNCNLYNNLIHDSVW